MCRFFYTLSLYAFMCNVDEENILFIALTYSTFPIQAFVLICVHLKIAGSELKITAILPLPTRHSLFTLPVYLTWLITSSRTTS